MGKIKPNKYGYKPEDDEEESAEDRPGFKPEDEEPTVRQEGEVIEPTDDEDEEGEGGEKKTSEEGEPEPITFKTQKELDDYVVGKTKPVESTKPVKPDVPVKTQKEIEDEELEKLVFFKGSVNPKTGKWVGEAPKDWNDFARTIIKHLSPSVYAPRILKEIQNLTAAEKKEMADIDKEYDVEYDGMAAEGKVPKRGTKEGDEVNTQISTIGGEYGLTSMVKAYELWMKIPKAQGGGLDYKPAKKVNPSKQASRLIGSSKKTQASEKPKGKKMSYRKLHEARDVNELLDDDEK